MPRTKARPPTPTSQPKVQTLVATAFTTAQRTTTSHPRALSLLYTAITTSPELFITHYTHALNRVLLIFRRLPHVERLIHFIILVSSTPPFITLTLSYLLSFCNASSHAIRFRVMQIIAGVLARIEDEDDLTDEILDQIHDAVYSRMKDRVARVRAAAAAATCRFQTTGNLNEDPMAAELAHMCCDSSAAVRKAALKALAMAEGNWQFVVGRTRDVRADVRKVAYEVLGLGVDPAVFEKSERVAILKEGLGDRDEGVRKVVREVLLVRGWLQGACEWDVVALAKMLGGSEKEEDVLNILKVIFREESCSALTESVALDVNRLEIEDVLVMRAMAEVLEGGFADRFLEETGVYVEVLRYYRPWEDRCRHLLEICKCVDMGDEAGRKELEALLRVEFLGNMDISEETAEYAVRAMRCVMLEEDATLRILLEIVSQDLLPASRDFDKEGNRANTEETEQHDPLDSGTAIEQDEGEQSVSKQDLETLEWGRHRALTICREAFRLCGQGKSSSSAKNSLCTRLLQLAVLEQLISANEDLRYIAMECLGLYCLLDRSGEEARRSLPIFIQACRADLPEIQDVAVKIIVDLLMLFDFPNIGAEVNAEEGGQRRKSCSRTSVANSRTGNVSSVAEECITILSQNITHADGMMRSLAVQGLARLLFLRRVTPTATLLSRMLIVFHNPITEDDVQLRQCLSVFFPVFAAASPINRLRLEDSFKQTLDVILSAPPKSPLTAISITQVAQFVVHLTDSAIAPSKQNQGSDDVGRPADQIHERLAEMVLIEIIDGIESYEKELCRTYGRILSTFRFACNAENVSQIGRLRKLAQNAIQECDDKRTATVLKRFRDRVVTLLEAAQAEGIDTTAVVRTSISGANCEEEEEEQESPTEDEEEEEVEAEEEDDQNSESLSDER